MRGWSALQRTAHRAPPPIPTQRCQRVDDASS